MNNVTTLKSTKTKCESPKTPGGISKSLLTPCRRVGLSRKWRNAGPSPFVSPLSTENSPRPEPVVEKKLPRKKSRVLNTDIGEEIATQSSQCEPKSIDENKVENIIETNLVSSPVDVVINIVDTPTRSVQLPRKSKSRVSAKDVEVKCNESPSKTKSPGKEFKGFQATEDSNETAGTSAEPNSKPVQNKSTKNPTSLTNKDSVTTDQDTKVSDEVKIKTLKNEVAAVSKIQKSNSKLTTKPRSPNNLTKECVVVIQKKINRNALKSNNAEIQNDNTTPDIVKPALNPVSQVLFDSDSDEVPLCKINKNSKENKQTDAKKRSRETLDDDDDFLENTKVKKLEEKNTSTELKLKINKKTLQIIKKPLSKKSTTQALVYNKNNPSSQESCDDDDDFDFDNKKTILIRKTYEKVTKPQKAKSTGSITQRDIEELKARIQMKKTQLLAKTMTKDTEELRNLIKRWRKGCQDALVELMDLMKSKCPEKCLDYSEILRMLKIPPGLVGYDSDNDSFISPDDNSIILSKFDV